MLNQLRSELRYEELAYLPEKLRYGLSITWENGNPGSERPLLRLSFQSASQALQQVSSVQVRLFIITYPLTDLRTLTVVEPNKQISIHSVDNCLGE